jgi:hypothetical protein
MTAAQSISPNGVKTLAPAGAIKSIIEVRRLNQDDIFEVEGTFYTPMKK